MTEARDKEVIAKLNQRVAELQSQLHAQGISALLSVAPYLDARRALFLSCV
jgi:hypothetical protein